MLVASSTSIAHPFRRSISAPRERRSSGASARHARRRAAREATRLRAHFSEVLAELRARDVAPLSASQRAMRARLLAELERYARAGRFPRNLDFPGVRTPYFVDASGTRCAMAHLIESTGAGEIVARVAAAKNNAFVRELAADPALVAWLEQAGLTAFEAGRIQPGYCFVTNADACFCGYGDGPRPAVLEGTVTAKSTQGLMTVKVTAVYGDATAAMVGQEVQANPNGHSTTGESSGSDAEVGDSILISVTEIPITTTLFNVGERLAADGTVVPACTLHVPTVAKVDMIAALLSTSDDPTTSASSCSEYLATIDPVWGEPRCTESGGGLVLTSSSSSSSSAASSGSGGSSSSGGDSGGCALAGPAAGYPLVLGPLFLAALWSRRRRARRSARQRTHG